MPTRYAVDSFAHAITDTFDNIWQTAKNYFTVEPMPLWQKAMEEESYQAYRRFKSNLAYQSDVALQDIVSPYAVIASKHTTDSQKEMVRQLLCSNSESTLNYFYHDMMNHLVELSVTELTSETSEIQAFKAMLAFYESYVPDDIYQTILSHCDVIAKTNSHFQASIVDVVKKINYAFKSFQMPMNSEMEIKQETKNTARENHKLYRHSHFNQLVVLSAISLLASKNNLGIGLDLAITVLFSESVDAALPIVANPIPTQYAEIGQTFSYDIDLNDVFSDVDGGDMTFGGAFIESSSTNITVTAEIKKIYGRAYDNNAVSLIIVNNTAIYSTNNGNWVAFDVSNPANKLFLSQAYIGAGSYIHQIKNNVVYAGLQYNFYIVDITTPSKPVVLSTIGTPRYSNNIFVNNDIAYVSSTDEGLQLINVTNASNPLRITSYPNIISFAMTIDNQQMYLGVNFNDFQVFNLSNVTNPMFISNYTFADGTILDIKIQHNFAYVSCNTQGFHILDISNPYNISQLGEYYDGYIMSSTIVDNIAYIQQDFYLLLLNISNLRLPTFLARYTMSGDISGMKVINNLVYITDNYSGLRVLNVTNPRNPILVGEYDKDGLYNDVIIDNHLAYVSSYQYGLEVVNFTNLANLTHLGGNIGGRCNDINLYQKFAYLSNDIDGVQVINISDPYQLNQIGYYPNTYYVRRTVVDGSILYVVDGDLQLLNLNNLSFINKYTSGYFESVSIDTMLAYALDLSGNLTLINVSEPLNLRLVKSYNILNNPTDIFIQNSIAFITDGDYGLKIINLSNTNNMTVIAQCQTPGHAERVVIRGPMLYVSDGAAGIQIINISDLANPFIISSYNTPGYANGIALDGKILYVADTETSLQIFDLSHTILRVQFPTNLTGNFTLRVSAISEQGEIVSTTFNLVVINSTSGAPMPSPIVTATTAQFSSSISIPAPTVISAPSSLSNPTASTSVFQSSNLIQFIVTASSIPILIQDGSATLTADSFSIIGNVNSNQIVYTVLGNHPDIVITVNGVVATQFTQADVEGNFVELSLQGVTCGDYSTDLQLEANVAGSNAPAQQVSVGLILEGTTCSNAEKPSPFSFRDTHIGFWAQKQEIEQKRQPMQSHNHMPRFRY